MVRTVIVEPNVQWGEVVLETRVAYNPARHAHDAKRVLEETWHNVIFRFLTRDRFNFILVKVYKDYVRATLQKGVRLDGVHYRVDLMSGSLFKPDAKGIHTLIGIPQEAAEFFSALMGFEESVYYASRALFPRHIAGLQGRIPGRAYALPKTAEASIVLRHKHNGQTVSLLVHDGWGYIRGSAARKMESALGARPKRRHQSGSNANYQMFQWFKTERPEVISELASTARENLAPALAEKSRYSALTTGRPHMQLGVAMPTAGRQVVFPSNQDRFKKAAKGGVILSRSPADKPNCHPVQWDDVECVGPRSDFLAEMECLQYTWTGMEDGALTFFKGMLGVIPEEWWPEAWAEECVVVCAKDRKLDARWCDESDRDRAHARDGRFTLDCSSLVVVDWFAAGEAVGVPYDIQSWLGGDYDGDEVQVLFEKTNPRLFQQVVDEFEREAVNPKLPKSFHLALGTTREARILAMMSRNTGHWSTIAATMNALPLEARLQVATRLGLRGGPEEVDAELWRTIQLGIKVGTDSYKTSASVTEWEQNAARYSEALKAQFQKVQLPYSKALIALLEQKIQPSLTEPGWRDVYFQCVDVYQLPALTGLMPLRGVSRAVLGRVVHDLLAPEQQTLEALTRAFTLWLQEEQSVPEAKAKVIANGEAAQTLLKEHRERFGAVETGPSPARPPPTSLSAKRGPSGWTEHLQNVHGYLPAPHGVLGVVDVLHQLPNEDGPASFWQAYQLFVQANPENTYELSPVDVLRWKKRLSPTALYIMAGPSDWAEYERFKRQHPEFKYSH
ncbi:hypothetical protein BON30_18730 [Cystobacter ferrugineus]|uniref:Uncharacterized protein n=1 Tax=Cystobacter ferrugineus TaxID=83449 RepID=A0A1L9BB90_9BACT|nr:hypothetical protein BON30_18730 [Cystobacter ferrugineus]